jgi:chemotaxis protein MotB
MFNRILTVALVIAVAGMAGCAELKQLRAENKGLKSQLVNLQADRDRLSQENLDLVADVAEKKQLEADLAAAQDRERQGNQLVAELRGEQQKLEAQAGELKQLLKNIKGVGLDERPDGNFIVMDNSILFETGKADLTQEAQSSLNKVADYLLSNPDVPIRIDGHTDGVPIRVSGWKNNYHLGAMRALAVMTYLVDRGVSSSRMYVTSFGPNRPVVQPPEAEADMPENRRVEIMLVPKGMRSIGEILDKFAS